MSRLNAFTIIELCVVMLLTAIVTGIAFFTLEIFQGSIRRFKTDSMAVADIALLHRLLTEDIWKCNEVKSTETGIRTLGKSGTCVYEFLPDLILRSKAERVDSFHFTIENLSFRYKKEDINIPDQLTDDIGFTLVHKEEQLPFVFHKTYGADVAMQNDLTTNY